MRRRKSRSNRLAAVTVLDLRPSGSTLRMSVVQFMRELEKDSLVENWLVSVTEKAKTRDVYLRGLAYFLIFTGWKPVQIFDIKRAALKEGEPISEVEVKIRQFHELLRKKGIAGKSRGVALSGIYTFIQSRGYSVPRKLVRWDLTSKLEMRVPTREEVERFVEYASSLPRKLLYRMMVESPCRPRVYPALRWNWLEPEWWTKDVIHVTLPKQFRPEHGSGPRKFEPICFLGSKTITLMKQQRDALIRAGKPPLETDRILDVSQDAVGVAILRDGQELTQLGLIRASRVNERKEPIEQSLSPKAWRKYQFNIIDALADISPEWRSMLKGRDLRTERYYSQENVEALRDIYRTRIYPQLWSDTVRVQETETVKRLEEQLEELKLKVQILQDASDLRVVIQK